SPTADGQAKRFTNSNWFQSRIIFPAAGSRNDSGGILYLNAGYYWSGSISGNKGTDAFRLYFGNDLSLIETQSAGSRTNAFSVRCVKNRD
ncbi:MAG: fibrobacter succinogenes major paralogous domain-containing protein, partial [Dysgonamonadaceae bacterium]|nr:fibrobacter succinogenes major paralogous domain-containing protein [Dysgonamonadaceae bacterium]